MQSIPRNVLASMYFFVLAQYYCLLPAPNFKSLAAPIYALRGNSCAVLLELATLFDTYSKFLGGYETNRNPHC